MQKGYIKCFVRREDVDDYLLLMNSGVMDHSADIIISIPELSEEEYNFFGSNGTTRIYHGIPYEKFKEINDELSRNAEGYLTGVHTETIVIYETPKKAATEDTEKQEEHS